MHVAFELVIEEGKFSEKYLQRKQELYSQTLPDYELLGLFYILPEGMQLAPTSETANFYHQISEIVTDPVVVILSPSMTKESDDLPLKAFEFMRTEWVSMPVKVETGEAERIAVDDLVKTSDTSAVSLQTSAVKMFHQKLKTVLQYVKDVQSGNVEDVDYDLLRKINCFALQLTKSRDRDYVGELDALATGLFALLMKSEEQKLSLNEKWVRLKTTSRRPKHPKRQNHKKNASSLPA